MDIFDTNIFDFLSELSYPLLSPVVFPEVSYSLQHVGQYKHQHRSSRVRRLVSGLPLTGMSSLFVLSTDPQKVEHIHPGVQSSDETSYSLGFRDRALSFNLAVIEGFGVEVML